MNAGSTRLELDFTANGAQMSTDWIDNAIAQMKGSLNIDVKNMGDLLYINKNLIKRHVITVDKQLGQPVIMELDIYQR